MIEEKLLTSLDANAFMQSSAWNFKSLWSGKVDVSVWLRAKIPLGGRLYLVLEYHDQDGKHTTNVDRCMTAPAGTILLNGRELIAGKGELEAIQLKLKFVGCSASQLFIEEVSLRARGQAQVPVLLHEAV